MKKHSIDHRERKHEIIVESVRLFARLGYRDVTFQTIAENCGVARTVLYRYFRDKRQIFDAAIVEALQRIVRKHTEIVHSDAPAPERIRQICATVTATLFDNRDFLAAIIDFVMSMSRDGHDMTRRIKRYTLGLKRVLHTLIAYGVHRGEFRPGTDPEVTTNLLYAIFESAVLRLVVSGDGVQTEVLDNVDHVLKGIRA